MSKATLYLEESVHQALRLKSAETHRSMSEIVNEAIRILLSEDQSDIADWNMRKGEKSVSYETFLEQLKADGTI